MHESIQTIQNSLWKYYKQFLQDKDMELYNRSIQNLSDQFKLDPVMHSFCMNLIITWAPIINRIKEMCGVEK